MRASLAELEAALRHQSIVILEDPSGSYIQAGGGPVEYTVEVRLVAPDGSFRHWKARRPGVTGGSPRYVLVGEQAVKLEAAEVLPADLALKLFEHCLDAVALAPEVEWADISHWFKGETD